MPQSGHDYFRYLPFVAASAPWGLAVTAAGYTEIAPGTAYPPARHPDDHDFVWETGRKLAALQIVSIQKGRGWFESRATGLVRISAGMAFLVLPGVWHRYRPDRSTGWTESWVELKGAAVDRLIRARVLRQKSVLKKRVAGTRLDEALSALHVRVRKSSARFDPAVTAGAYEILAAWGHAGEVPDDGPSSLHKIIEAEHYLSTHFREPIVMETFAASQGMAYSYFRKLFREHTGYAPWTYVIRIRLVRARRLLLQSSAKLESIADELGFSSAFHFSAAFKAAFGESPSSWRTRHDSGRKR